MKICDRRGDAGDQQTERLAVGMPATADEHVGEIEGGLLELGALCGKKASLDLLDRDARFEPGTNAGEGCMSGSKGEAGTASS